MQNNGVVQRICNTLRVTAQEHVIKRTNDRKNEHIEGLELKDRTMKMNVFHRHFNTTNHKKMKILCVIFGEVIEIVMAKQKPIR